MFEKVVYNLLLNHFQSNKLFTSSQSGFLPDNSCIAQLLSIIHEIYTAFDNNSDADVSGVFLVTLKAFDKVLHSSYLFKLQGYGVKGELIALKIILIIINKE